MYKEVINKIEEYDTIVIARHIGVDPDALCSQLALRDAIKLTYPDKKVLAIGTGNAKFLHIGRLDKVEKTSNALFIILDTPDKKRVDGVDMSQCGYSIKIDHHPFIEKFCDLEIIENEKTSASEIILNLIFESKLMCNDKIAELLYIGIVSDSNRFLFSSCSSSTFARVSKLLSEYNVDISKAYEKLFFRPLSEVRLRGYISLNMIVTDNNLGYIVISDDIINEYGVDAASAGNMVNDFNYIKEVLVWATITEDKKNSQYRISIRSRGPEINDVCKVHNGGGHKFASGVRAKTLDEAMSLVRDLDKMLEEYNKKELR